MCGRFGLTRRAQYLRDQYGIEDDIAWVPRYDTAPTQQVAVLHQNPEKTQANVRRHALAAHPEPGD